MKKRTMEIPIPEKGFRVLAIMVIESDGRIYETTSELKSNWPSEITNQIITAATDAARQQLLQP